MEYVAPELLERYPIIDPGYFAKGSVRSKSVPNLCLEMSNHDLNEAEDVPASRNLRLKTCGVSHVDPPLRQSFTLTWHRHIQHSIYDYCLDNSLTVVECHFQGGNQLWKFDLVRVMLPTKNLKFYSIYSHRCGGVCR